MMRGMITDSGIKRRSPGGGRKRSPTSKVRVYGFVPPDVAKWLESQGGNIHAGVTAVLTKAFEASKVMEDTQSPK